MKKLIFSEDGKRNCFLGIATKGLFLLLFLFMMGNAMSAQSSASGMVISSKSQTAVVAQQLGITVYNFNSWNLQTVEARITQRLNGTNGNSSDIRERFKAAYYNIVLDDMKRDVAPQIAMINRLTEIKVKFSNSSLITETVMRNIYNELVSSF